MDKITKRILEYPEGQQPNFIIPQEYGKFRYALGRMGENPLVVVCMNPSAAKEDYSDMTVNRIIAASEKLNYDGWIIFNLYPERATDAKNLERIKEDVCKRNNEIIRDFLLEHNIREVWGAWGDTKGIKTLKQAKDSLLNMFASENVCVYYFGTLTKEGNPRHPLQRNEKVIFDEKNRKNFELHSYLN